jgi:hypothetical protein
MAKAVFRSPAKGSTKKKIAKPKIVNPGKVKIVKQNRIRGPVGGARLTVSRVDNQLLIFVNDTLVYIKSVQNNPPLNDRLDLTPWMVSGRNSFVFVGGNLTGSSVNPSQFAYRIDFFGGDPAPPIEVNFFSQSPGVGIVFHRTYSIPKI